MWVPGGEKAKAAALPVESTRHHRELLPLGESLEDPGMDGDGNRKYKDIGHLANLLCASVNTEEVHSIELSWIRVLLFTRATT